jgi:guanine deaminase
VNEQVDIRFGEPEQEYMRLAIRKAQEGISRGQSPFGSAIVRAGHAVAVTHNTVWLTCDPTAHAEVNCIRAAATALKTISLQGCTLYSTTEPCPMCLSAIHWAKIDRVVFGATIADATTAGFSELGVPAATLAQMGGSPLVVESGLLQQECAALFDEWLKSGKAKVY